MTSPVARTRVSNAGRILSSATAANISDFLINFSTLRICNSDAPATVFNVFARLTAPFSSSAAALANLAAAAPKPTSKMDDLRLALSKTFEVAKVFFLMPSKVRLSETSRPKKLTVKDLFCATYCLISSICFCKPCCCFSATAKRPSIVVASICQILRGVMPG